MNKLAKEKNPITDEKIVILYDTGWSISDIVSHYKTNVVRVRRVLQNNGTVTSNYRAAPVFLKDCVLAMISSGLSVRRIADTIDVSAHLIRQILRSNGVNVSSLRNEGPFLIKNFSITPDMWNTFYSLYESGKCGFIKCAEEANFSVYQCVEVFCRLNEEDVLNHRLKLRKNILSHRSSGLSPTSVGKKLGVSVSIVKSVFNLNNTFDKENN